MNFLADAHVSLEMVAMIRALGHDVRDASSIPPRMPDLEILQVAAREQRVVLTADKDFGELVFVHRIPCSGVILLRIALASESERVLRLQAVWNTLLARLPRSFITVTASALRARPLP